jgi:hypothetical protein
MSVHKSDDFIADIERQFEWYALNANWEIAEHYLHAVEATPAGFSDNIRSLDRAVVSSIRDFATGGFSSCSGHSTNTSSFTKSPAMM